MKITFKEFLSESSNFDYDSACKKIKHDCEYFLKASRGNALFRGMRGISAEAGVVYATAPKNRSPKDSESGFNLMFNTGFDLAFDYPTIRTSCLYATGSHNVARAYGSTYFVFPKGDFSFVYSPEYEDSYEDSHKMYSAISANMEDALGHRLSAHVIETLFSALGFMTTKALIKGGADFDAIVENTVKHVGNFEKEEFSAVIRTDFHKILLAALKKTFKEDYKDSDNLERAIKLKHEIGFYEFEGYYSVPVKLVLQMLRNDKSELGTKYEDAKEDGAQDGHSLYPYLLDCIKYS